MGAPYVWSFTTGTTPDVVRPTVVATAPGTAELGVAINSDVTATFSETMLAGTVSTTTFTLVNNLGASVAGSVSYVGLVATFRPSARLAPSTAYTATVDSVVTDLAGNAMAADYVWTFTTGIAPDETVPRVTFTTPVDDATGVALDSQISAVFTEVMSALTLSTASFSIQQLDITVPGTVTYVGLTATFTPSVPLAPNTTYAATITSAATDLAGNRLARNYVWNFRTSAAPDTTRPTVISTVPLDDALAVSVNTAISATFDSIMNAATLTPLSFTLADGIIPVLGTVTLVGNTAVFTPAAPLDPSTLYTATVTTVAADLAGNGLAADFVWQFTTGVLPDTTAPLVILTAPLDEAIDVPILATVNATFDSEMAPDSIDTASFTLQGPGTTEVTGTVVYDALTRIARFTPDSDLLPATTYTATVTTTATDLAGNPLASDEVWTFSTGDAVLPGLQGVDLGSLISFVAVAGAGLTNSNSSGITILNGDVGLSPTGSCLGDGSICTITNPVINGTLYANDPEGVAALAKTDLTAAYVDASSRPPGTTVNDLSGLTLLPGVYTSGSTMSVAVGGTVTLDAQGDANAVWIFQIGSSLTINNSAQVLLVNGARAGNVFWAAFASSTLGSNVSFQGNVLAGASNTVGTDSTVVGRLLCITGAISLLSNTITLPAP
jgi:hypothetical protein